MLVDVPVVASDGINRALHQGEPRLRAAWLGPARLRHPMVFGTIINIVAFLPLLLLPGDKGVFISGLPIVVTLCRRFYRRNRPTIWLKSWSTPAQMTMCQNS